MGTAVVGIILFTIVYCIVRNMLKDVKNGKSIQCGCDCSKCGGACHKG